MALSFVNYLRESFLNRICTVITVPVNRNFAEEAHAISKPQLYPINLLDHFMGRLIMVEPSYLVIEHPELRTKTLFRMEQIVSVVEEQVLDPNNPEHAKAINEYKQYNARTESQPAPQTPEEDDSQKVACPSCKNKLRVPQGIEDGSLVKCPICTEEFTIARRTNADFIDVDDLKRLAEEAAEASKDR